MSSYARIAAVLLLGLAAPACAQDQEQAQESAPRTDPLQADVELLQSAEGSRSIGGDSPVVTIVEFFDPACSTCREFHTQRGDSLAALAGPDVRIEYRIYLIPRLVRGWHGAEAASCAAALGGYEAFSGMLDRVMGEWDAWRGAAAPAEVFSGWGVSLGLDRDRLADCLARDVPAPLVASDILLATSFDVQGTPTFVFIPRGASSPDDLESFYGNQPMERFRQALDSARSRAR